MTIGTASEPSALTEAGLIGYANGAVIKDINMTDVSIYTSVAGIISGSGTLSVSSSRGVGGIVGLKCNW